MCTTGHAISKLLTSADGTAIYAEAKGDPSKPAVVFIHGFSMSTQIFENIFNDPKWIEHAYLVRYDTRGHGRSGMPVQEEAWNSSRLAEDFDAVVEGFGLIKPFVAGWSAGSMSLTDILSVHPQSYLSGAIHISPTPYMGAIPQVVLPLAASLLPVLASNDNVQAYQNAALGFLDLFVYDSRVLPHTLHRALLGDIMTQPRAVTARVLTRTQDPKGLFQAGENNFPMVLFYGKEDRVVSGLEGVKALHGEHCHWRDLEVVEMEETGHVPFLERPDQLREIALAFINRVREQ